eukprot:GSA25T00008948001.1
MTGNVGKVLNWGNSEWKNLAVHGAKLMKIMTGAGAVSTFYENFANMNSVCLLDAALTPRIHVLQRGLAGVFFMRLAKLHKTLDLWADSLSDYPICRQRSEACEWVAKLAATYLPKSDRNYVEFYQEGERAANGDQAHIKDGHRVLWSAIKPLAAMAYNAATDQLNGNKLSEYLQARFGHANPRPSVPNWTGSMTKSAVLIGMCLFVHQYLRSCLFVFLVKCETQYWNLLEDYFITMDIAPDLGFSFLKDLKTKCQRAAGLISRLPPIRCTGLETLSLRLGAMPEMLPMCFWAGFGLGEALGFKKSTNDYKFMDKVGMDACARCQRWMEAMSATSIIDYDRRGANAKQHHLIMWGYLGVTPLKVTEYIAPQSTSFIFAMKIMLLVACSFYDMLTILWIIDTDFASLANHNIEEQQTRCIQTAGKLQVLLEQLKATGGNIPGIVDAILENWRRSKETFYRIICEKEEDAMGHSFDAATILQSQAKRFRGWDEHAYSELHRSILGNAPP